MSLAKWDAGANDVVAEAPTPGLTTSAEHLSRISAQFPSVHPAPGLPTRVIVYEVGPRDGLQAEGRNVPTRAKAQFINSLASAGLPMVEATSFVSPKWIPQLADAAEVMALLEADAAHHPVLVPNATGLDRAVSAGAKAVAVFVSATETFANRNLNKSRVDAISEASAVAGRARAAGLGVRGYVSMCFGDPWEGPVDPRQVVATSRELIEAGCEEVSLGDTIGVGTGGHVEELIRAHVDAGIGPDRLALHFHDTYGQALANVMAGLRAGVTCFDASTAGIGGCPYAGTATGNLATEDLLWMLKGLGIETGVNLEAVVEAGRAMTSYLGRPTPSRAAQALLAQSEHSRIEGALSHD